MFVKASINDLNIDTRNKKAAFSSIVKIFTTWAADSPMYYNLIHAEDAYKLYLLINDLNSTNSWTSTQIRAAITNRGLTYSQSYIETYIYDSVTIEKKYVYDETRYDYRLDDDLENFSPSLVSYYNNYLGTQAFYGGYEHFNFVITTTYTTSGGGGFILDNIIGPDSFGNEVVTNNLYFGTFVRYFNVNQTTYGYYSSYCTSYSFNYPETIIKNSVLASNIVVMPGAVIEDSIIMDSCTIGKGSHIKKAIIDRFNIIPDNSSIGIDKEHDSQNYFIDPSGIVVIPRGRTKFL